MQTVNVLKMKKGQVSTEFIFFVAAAFILLTVYLVISYNYFNLTFKRRDTIAGTDLLESLRNEINIASRVENGYTKILTLPNKINKQEYSLNLKGTGNRELSINFNKVDYAKLMATNVNVDKNGDSLYFSPGNEIFITKINNKVYIDKTCDPINDEEVCSLQYPLENCENKGCLLKCENRVFVFEDYCNGCSENRVCL